MISLCCESSTLLGSVALFKDHNLLSFRESPRQGSHSDILNIFIEQVLEEAKLQLTDVDLFVSGIGPGSFTGIRISLNTIKTFGYCFNKPVLGLNSLENLAWQCDESELPIIAMLNAYKNMVYIATYKKINSKLVAVAAPEVVRVQNLSSYITENAIVVGDGYLAYAKYFTPELQSRMIRISPCFDEPTACALGPLIMENYAANRKHWSQLLPLYLRASEAEENKLGIKFQPLI